MLRYAEALKAVEIGRQEMLCMPTRRQLEAEDRGDLVDLVNKCGGVNEGEAGGLLEVVRGSV